MQYGLPNALSTFRSHLAHLSRLSSPALAFSVLPRHRIEYDAYRADLEWLQQGGETAAGAAAKVEEARRLHDAKKAHYEKLRADVVIKLRFLNENRVRGVGRDVNG